jgi:hypothetical protein
LIQVFIGLPSNAIKTDGNFITTGICFSSSDAVANLYRPSAGVIKTDGDLTVTGVQNGGHPRGSAAATSVLVLSTTQTDIPGATITLATAGTYLIHGSFDYDVPTAAGVAAIVGQLVVNGVAQTAQALFVPTADAQRVTTAQTWIVAVGAGQVVKLQAAKPFATGGTARAMDVHTTIRAVRIDS